MLCERGNEFFKYYSVNVGYQKFKVILKMKLIISASVIKPLGNNRRKKQSSNADI